VELGLFESVVFAAVMASGSDYGGIRRKVETNIL
jgi:hypothetical protein